MGSNNKENQNTIAGALTYPSRSEENAQPTPMQPRQPRNLQGLLRFAMEATKAEDAPGNSELGPMDEERRKFLEEALKSLTVDVAQVLQDAIKVLTDTEKIQGIQFGQALPQEVQTSFNNLLEYVDDIDVANDFYKMGGFAMFPICYGSDNEEVRAAASQILGEVCQNNPFCQARALECGLLNVLLNLIQSEQGNTLAKCLFAISCATREFPPACKELLSQGACANLAQLLSNPDCSARTKTAFLIRYLCQHYAEAKHQFREQNLVRIITEQIKSGRDETTEHLLSLLCALTEGLNATVLQQCRDPSVGLKKVLENHLTHPDLKDDTYSEEKEYCQEVLSRVFDNYTQLEAIDEEIADR